MTEYVCVGRVRGWCGEVHTSFACAEECAASDVHAIRDLGGGAYSDREVYEASDLPRTVDGSFYLPAGRYVARACAGGAS